MNTRSFRQLGFTLVELITAITIMALLSSIGIASFLNYSRIQELNSATQNVVTMLQQAKASTESQVKPSLSCNPGPLNGYRVKIDSAPSAETYTLVPICATSEDTYQKTETLPTNIIFTANSTQSVTFETITGNVTILPAGSTITLQHKLTGVAWGSTQLSKTITVETDGRIHVQ